MATYAPAIEETMVKENEEQVVRFDIHQRIQHILMITSFTALAFTGLPQKFNTWTISESWVTFLGGIEAVRAAHRFFAWMMLADAVYHVAYLVARSTSRNRPLPLGMLPNLGDMRGMIQEIRYFVGVSRVEPKYDRFNWREKFDYWAVFWGVPVLGLSGLILMFPMEATRFLPGIAIPMALVAHSDEAFLAVAWIFGAHFFFTHLAPGVFPLNKSIFTGRIPVSRLRTEHPLEWEKMQAAVAVAAAPARKVVEDISAGEAEIAVEAAEALVSPAKEADANGQPEATTKAAKPTEEAA